MPEYFKTKYGVATNKRFRDLARIAQKASLRQSDSMLIDQTGGGQTVTPDVPDEFWVRITEVGAGSQAGAYGWIMQVGRRLGAWVDGQRNGTLSPLKDPLYEVNALTTLKVNDVVFVSREEVSNELRVQSDVCGA